MKLPISKFELFAVTSHLCGLPSPNPEHGRKRLKAWDQLGVADLADQLTASAVGFAELPKVTDWNGRERTDVDLTDDVVDHVLAGLRLQVAGLWTDTVTRVRERIEEAKKGG